MGTSIINIWTNNSGVVGLLDFLRRKDMESCTFELSKKCSYCDKYGYTSKLLKDGTLVRLCEIHINCGQLG